VSGPHLSHTTHTVTLYFVYYLFSLLFSYIYTFVRYTLQELQAAAQVCPPLDQQPLAGS